MPGPRRSACWRRRSHRSKNLRSTAKVARGLGTANIDHRLRRVDFRDQANDPVAPTARLHASPSSSRPRRVLVVGSNLRKEVPLLAHRVRQAAVRRGAKIVLRQSARIRRALPGRRRSSTSNGLGMAQHLAAVLVAALRAQGKPAPAHARGGARRHRRRRRSTQAVAALLDDGRPARDPARGARRSVTSPTRRSVRWRTRLAAATGRNARLPAGRRQCRRAPRSRACCRIATAGGRAVAQPGLNAVDMLAARLKAYVLRRRHRKRGPRAAATTEAALRGADAWSRSRRMPAKKSWRSRP